QEEPLRVDDRAASSPGWRRLRHGQPIHQAHQRHQDRDGWGWYHRTRSVVVCLTTSCYGTPAPTTTSARVAYPSHPAPWRFHPPLSLAPYHARFHLCPGVG